MRRTVTNVDALFNIATLLYGNRNLCYDDNVKVFLSVHKYIKKSERFA